MNGQRPVGASDEGVIVLCIRSARRRPWIVPVQSEISQAKTDEKAPQRYQDEIPQRWFGK